MKRIFFFKCLWLFLTFFITSLYAQVEMRTGNTIICDAGRVDGQSYKKILKSNHKPKNRRAKGEPIFEVKYSGFTEEARAAFQYAIDIWEEHLDSDIKIRIFANWAYVENLNTLAFVTPTEVKNFKDAPLKNIWYPATLAEKLARADINPQTEADIVATFNNRRTDWYFGLDGNCPANKTDLVTVALHELGHGLGFSDTFFANTSAGYSGLSDGLPKIYDTFLRNGLNQPLLEFPNNSFALATQLTNNSVVFVSPVTRILTGFVSNPKIYSPSPFNPGSSIAHVDQATYDNTINGLMTPFVSWGKVVHNPGPLTKGMLYEMGWLNVFIDHDPLPDMETNSNIRFSATLQKDTLVRINSMMLHYSFDNFETAPTSLVLSMTSEDTYELPVSFTANDVGVAYFFTVEDVLGRKYRLPINQNENFSFFSGIDTEPPTITHTPKDALLPVDVELIVAGTIRDNIGIKESVLEYKLNTDGEVNEIMIQVNDMGAFTKSINLRELNIVQGDVIFYRIRSTDTSASANMRQIPAQDFFAVPVRIFNPVRIYTDDFAMDRKNMFGDFSIQQPVGFINAAIHSPHPYPKSPTSASSFDLIYTLLTPIIVDAENTLIAFDEVVLVEPDESQDYLIVEATKVGEDNWQPLLEGYDSRDNEKWLNYYNSSITAGDSRAVGTVNFFVNRTINLLEQFEPEDTIQIRFRLHTDHQGAGWGWAIDNLKIQNVVVGLGDDDVQKEFVLYPNPVLDKVFISSLERNGLSEVQVFNAQGKQVECFENVKDYIGVENLSPGIYFVRINTNGQIITKKIVKQ